MKHIKKGLLLVVMFTLAFTMLLTTQKVKADSHDDITGTLAPEMREAVKRGILLGYGEGKYGQEEQVTRAQFAAFIKRALNLPEAQATFKDVTPNMTLATSVNAVAGAGIMQGVTSDRFNPDALITREQVALTIENALIYSKMELVKKETLFSDASLMTSATKLAIFHATNYGIINGIPNDDGTMRFEPKSNTTRAQAAAFIVRFLEAKESYVPPVGGNPGEPTDPASGFQLASIQDGKIERVSKIYTEYNDAAMAFNNSTAYQVMYNGSEIIRVKQGIAYGNNFKGIEREVTTVYLDPEFTKQVTYIEHGREMRYIGSNEKYIKVQVGATIGYVKHSQTEMIPLSLVTKEKRDHYKVSSYGTLIHFIMYHNKNSLTSYIVGPAPEFMDQGIHYYSHDGIHFSNSTGASVGINVPYFQYLSARTKTNYTAQEIDAYIMKVLAEKEKVDIRYANATTKSKLIGLGQQLKEVEKTQRVNALMILSLGMHESDYGMSETAQKCNNLFGLYKYDSLNKLCPPQGTFATPSESVKILIEKFWNLNYIDPKPQATYVQKNQGAAFGNKTTGFNVNYASDPTWGAKAGYRYYSMDKEMGGKDLHNYKKIGFTKYGSPTTINVRTSPEAKDSSNTLFTYQARNVGVFEGDETGKGYPLGYPVTIVETVKGADGYNWYKIISDRIDAEYGWIRSDVVNVIEYP